MPSENFLSIDELTKRNTPQKESNQNKIKVKLNIKRKPSFIRPEIVHDNSYACESSTILMSSRKGHRKQSSGTLTDQDINEPVKVALSPESSVKRHQSLEQKLLSESINNLLIEDDCLSKEYEDKIDKIYE